MRFPPANIQLRRAQLVLMLAILVPTILMTGVGVILLVLGSGITTLISGLLVLTFCTSGITGYILVQIFVTRGAGLARVQNDFTSAVSHELRTPITSITLLLESLRDDRLSASDRAEVLTLLARETKRLETLTDKVLELSRLETRPRHVWPQGIVDVRDLVDEAVGMFDAATLSNPTPIAIDVERDLKAVGDRDTLIRAVGNLLHNAWKYSGPDKQIGIEAHAMGRRVEILVRDNGFGIERDDQPSIYEQFIRGRAINDTGIPGVGLGLAFVRTIVRGNRGKLDFESEPGRTTFRIRLRRVREPTGQAKQIAVAS
ncbi:MAG: HAMP domain-containing sensor histidine kinase [Deltaproteobacteria bacterium]